MRFLLLLLALCVTPVIAQTSDSGIAYTEAETNMANLRRQASCRILVHQSGKRQSSAGSGTLTATQEFEGKHVGVILTCAHVLNAQNSIESQSVNVVFHDNLIRQAKVLAVDWNNDLMGLAVFVDPKLIPIPLQAPDEFSAPNEDVYMCGFGGEGKYQCHIGKLRHYTSAAWDGGATKAVPARPGHRFVSSGNNQFSVDSHLSRSGDSGGGMFNSNGEMVGVFWGSRGGDSLGVFSGSVHNFMQTFPENYQWACDRRFGGRRQPAQPAPQPVPQQPAPQPVPQQPAPQPVPQQPAPQQPDTPDELLGGDGEPAGNGQPVVEPTSDCCDPDELLAPINGRVDELHQDHQAILDQLARLEQKIDGLVVGQETIGASLLNLPTKQEVGDSLQSLADGMGQMAESQKQATTALEQLQTKLDAGGGTLTLDISSPKFISPSYVDVSVLWALQQKTGIDHVVIIADTTAAYWQRLEVEIKAAQKVFPALTVVTVNNTGLRLNELPKAVVYSTKPKEKPVIFSGTDGVAKVLQALTREESLAGVTGR